ncbi:Zinc finger C2H2-type protein [Macrophomina phaseolina MS6]|uniref:Zinc finger C2H2-type protein n=1 Tax=Macrophomina phaseolina (strain MS6) TaxID=1126212 RepID=K2SDP3_MACPH|nr:Zinc finger C2H2-type protein [Macrophomina phaseolina MS6]
MSFECRKPDCGEVFSTEKSRKRHCDLAEDHEYCKKCDYLAEDWDDLTAHKANSPKVHLCCKFCGHDFKTISGRDHHIKQLHPVDQDLRCAGCNEHFVRAASLVQHLEFGHCPKISAQQFRSNVQHKHIVSKILESPEALSAKIFDFNVNDTDSTGGVAVGSTTELNLLDDDGGQGTTNLLESQIGGSVMQPLQPDVKPRPANAPRLGERWPSLPISHRNTSATDISSSMAKVSLSDPNGGAPVPSSGVPSVQSPPSSITSTKPPKSHSTPNSRAWDGSSSASEVLFKGAQKTPVTTEWEAALQAKNDEDERANSTNIFMQRYWDPTNKDYDPERFYNPVIEMYVCPLPQCEANYSEPFMLEHHINTVHGISQRRCPHCLKLFKSVTALVAHCEASTSQCGISRSSRYGEVIDQFSGGFLGAKDAHRSDITEWQRQDKLGDDGQLMHGSGYRIGMTKYESTLPADWPSGSFRFREKGKIVIGPALDQGGLGPNRHVDMNPAVPLSTSRKQHHSTANIYPQPFKDFIPELTSSTFDLSREQVAEEPIEQMRREDAWYTSPSGRSAWE